MNSIYRKRRSPYGFGFLGVDDTKKLQNAARAAQNILVERGFQRVMPPTFDYPETFSGIDSGNSFQTRDHLGEDLSIRNDVTVQLIKGFSNLLDVSPEQTQHRFFYTLPVFKDASRSYPALREIFQLGAEVIGQESKKVIPDILQLVCAIAGELTPEPMKILVGDVSVARAMIETAEAEYRPPIKSAILQRNATILGELLENTGFSSGNHQALARLLLFAPEQTHVFFKRLEAFHLPAGLYDKLHHSFLFAEEVKKEIKDVHWDPLLFRPNDYYSGLIFEGYFTGLVHPPIRGGSYDNLVGSYSQNELPASGFAVDLSSMLRIFHPL